MTLENTDPTIFTIVDNYALWLQKAGWYWIKGYVNGVFFLPGNSVGLYVYQKVPPATTLSYKANGLTSDTASTGNHLFTFDQILEFPTANTEIVWAMGYAATYGYPYFEVEYLPESTTIVNNITTNEYINPPTSNISYVSLSKNYTASQQLFNASNRLNVQISNYSVISGGNLTLIFAPNSSSNSYISCSKTMLAKL